MATEYGDRAVAEAGTILRTLVGSGVHGLAIEGTDDRDEMGIYIEPAESVLGPQGMERLDYIYRTQDEGKRSGPDDLDLTLYSLRKYLHLALKGNPTVLLPLWCAPEDIVAMSEEGELLRLDRDVFMTKSAVYRFVGYLDSQVERLTGGGKRNRVPNRPELVEKFGYDVKYASHALRLGFQGREIVSSGQLTLPMRDMERSTVLSVKQGKLTLPEVLVLIADLRAQVVEKVETADLPNVADVDRVRELAVRLHRMHWNW